MQKYLGRWEATLYGLFRIVTGLLFAFHGAQKLLGWFGGMDGQGGTAEMFTQMWLAGVIELFGGLLVAVGLFAGWVAIVCSVEMFVAYFMVHAPQSPWPILNGGELAALYAFAFLFIASRGAGALSLARAMGKRRLE